MADLIPTSSHVPLPYVMGYDIRPLVTLKEKELLLNMAAEENFYLFLEHDLKHEIITVKHTSKGVCVDKTFLLNTFFWIL